MAEVAKKDFGVDMNATTFTGTVTETLIGSKYAEDIGKFDAYQSNVFKGYWQDDRDISDLNVLVAIAAESGIDPELFVENLSNERYLKAVEQDVDQAFEFGINGVPAMILDNKYLVTGARPYPAMVEIVEQVLSMRAGAV